MSRAALVVEPIPAAAPLWAGLVVGALVAVGVFAADRFLATAWIDRLAGLPSLVAHGLAVAWLVTAWRDWLGVRRRRRDLRGDPFADPKGWPRALATQARAKLTALSGRGQVEQRLRDVERDCVRRFSQRGSWPAIFALVLPLLGFADGWQALRREGADPGWIALFFPWLVTLGEGMAVLLATTGVQRGGRRLFRDWATLARDRDPALKEMSHLAPDPVQIGAGPTSLFEDDEDDEEGAGSPSAADEDQASFLDPYVHSFGGAAAAPKGGGSRTPGPPSGGLE